jgi:hypothetical protein
MKNKFRLLSFFLLSVAIFISSCAKEDVSNNQEALTQQRIDEFNKSLAPGAFCKLEPGVELTDEGIISSLETGVADRSNTCTATINVVLGAGSTVLVNGVGMFMGPTPGGLNQNVSFPITNGQTVFVSYGGRTGITVTQINSGGCTVFSVPPSTTFRVVSANIRLWCDIVCYNFDPEKPLCMFS